jgi:glycosyltransferase involved in cell wall biosynthesis
VVSHEYGLYQNLDGGFYAGLKRLGKPIITICHAVGNFVVDKVVADVSSKVIVHNEFCARHFQGDKSKVVIIPHGCEPKECPPMDECKRAWGINSNVPIVGYQGFISPMKGVDLLVEAMQGVPNAALLVGGGWFVGEETQYIMALKQWSLSVLKGRCQWLGYVPDEQLATAYGAMDILCYCSRTATESGALLMGLSHGRATIASALPPFKEKEKKGALMTFKDVEELRRKIKRLLKDKQLRCKLEEGARRYSKSVQWSEVAKRHVDLYKQIVA